MKEEPGDARDKRSGEQRTDAWNAIEALARLIGATRTVCGRRFFPPFSAFGVASTRP